ncbi:unnamed protein product [Cylindrotheca closterium]|uniref:J domain-containing protein n=1 Tax=Cylindrotheca closterium TaxID=2856 RepID=A0AAD2GEC4_9STRA|nr:unnamed protein product [Cylindrotheca closterium]
MRLDLSFFVFCCKSFLGDDESETNYYDLLGVERDASAEDVKKAYKRKSLQMHPDKLAQRGQTVTDELQAEFTKMKEAYEVLSDPHKRETYDAIGARGMKWIDEPFSIDPQDLATNFSKSSVVDRAKIFAIFVAVAVAILLLPIFICLHLDGSFGENASWFATFIPLWIWDGFLVFYHVRLIMMGPIERPEHIPEEEWSDPLPMPKRYMSFFRFGLLTLFEIFATLKLDDSFGGSWLMAFLPYYLWELMSVYKKWPMTKMKIVTIADLEAALGKSTAEFTEEEKEAVKEGYAVVSSLEGEDFQEAIRAKSAARQELVKSAFRFIFSLFLLLQLGGSFTLSWWLVFLPVWVISVLVCLNNYQTFAEVQKKAAEKDPTLFGIEGDPLNTSTDYGAVGVDGTATPDAAGGGASPPTPLTEDERENLKAEVMVHASNLCTKCCSQGFVLVLVCLFVAKLQGATFSSFWIISPFLLVAGIILCCLGFAIFGISEQPEDAELFNTTAAFGGETEPDTAANSPTIIPTDYAPPSTNKPEVDIELGGGSNNTTPTTDLDADNKTAESSAATPVDLLDTVPSKEQTDMGDLD